MTTRETVPEMTEGQRNEIIETCIGAIPCLNFYQAQVIINNKGPLVAGFSAVFKQYLGKKQETTLVPQGTIPADGVEFELTLESIDPMEMVRSDGYNPVIEYRSFKLVRVDDCANLNEVRKRLSVYGPIPGVQWREAFKKAFPQNDGHGSVGFAGPSWVDSSGEAYFAALRECGESWRLDLPWASDALYRYFWRWLVKTKSSRKWLA